MLTDDYRCNIVVNVDEHSIQCAQTHKMYTYVIKYESHLIVDLGLTGPASLAGVQPVPIHYLVVRLGRCPGLSLFKPSPTLNSQLMFLSVKLWVFKQQINY